MRLWSTNRTLLIAAIVVTAIVSTLINQFAFGPSKAQQDEHNTTDVRISAKQLEDGRVEFALQPRDGNSWGERILPRVRFFPANSRVDLWRNSSPIGIKTPTPTPAPMPMLCVVANGDPNKLFWHFVAFHSERAAKLIGVELDYSTHLDVDDRVEAIQECVDNGANMILATLADAETIIPALKAAAAQGVKIASFGAGEEHADRAESLIHVSLDESAAGRRAAEQFNSFGISGTVFCVVPHDAHPGRLEVCDFVAESYVGGHVEEFQLTSEEAEQQIEDLLTEHPDAAGLLVLEADLLDEAVEAMIHTGVKPVLGSIGEYPLSEFGRAFEKRDLIKFTVMDLARFEVLLSAAALHYMYSNHPNAQFFEGAMIFDGVPNVHTGGPKGGHGRPATDDGRSHDDGHDHDH